MLKFFKTMTKKNYQETRKKELLFPFFWKVWNFSPIKIIFFLVKIHFCSFLHNIAVFRTLAYIYVRLRMWMYNPRENIIWDLIWEFQTVDLIWDLIWELIWNFTYYEISYETYLKFYILWDLIWDFVWDLQIEILIWDLI